MDNIEKVLGILKGQGLDGFILQKRQMSNISVAIQMNLHMLLSALRGII